MAGGVGAVTGAVFSGLGAAGQLLGKSCEISKKLGNVVQLIPKIAKVTGGISVGMAGFDTISLGLGLFVPNNSLTELNQKLHSNAIYNIFQVAVSATAVFTGGFSRGLKTAVCFVAGTPILTASGLVSIENIKVGDKVISTNVDTLETTEKTVVETYIRKSWLLVHIWIDDKKTSVTPNHPYWVPEKGWVNAGELTALDQLRKPDSNLSSIQKIEIEELNVPVTVYNFEVEDFHTYYAGSTCILVHNADYPKTSAADWTEKTGELAKASPIDIPDNATIKIQAKTGYDQITYKWSESGYNYEVRWHTQTPGAPAGSGNSWVASRVTPGTPTGQVRVENIYTGMGDGWIPRWEWQAAIDAYKNGTMTVIQEALLNAGHWIAP